MRRLPEVTALSPEEIDFLQECFDAILKARQLTKDSEPAGDVARALLLAFQRGVRSRQELIRLADIATDGASGDELDPESFGTIDGAAGVSSRARRTAMADDEEKGR